ncbi:MAG: hypothetical protein M3N14_13170 [Bacteroidota bacterium]|nr:hypothetical protein [Bacteroidota bacterium]
MNPDHNENLVVHFANPGGLLRAGKVIQANYAKRVSLLNAGSFAPVRAVRAFAKANA